MKIEKKFFKNKKILITGHTGFKGGWLSVILNLLGSKVSGFALNPQGKNNFFNFIFLITTILLTEKNLMTSL